jgi:hypothetical protein
MDLVVGQCKFAHEYDGRFLFWNNKLDVVPLFT